jgi:hypothetical protein
MGDTTKLTDQTERGRRADIVVKELDGAFKALESDCFDTFSKSDFDDDRGRLACRIYMRVLVDVKERFERAVITGNNARQELVLMVNEEKKDAA